MEAKGLPVAFQRRAISLQNVPLYYLTDGTHVVFSIRDVVGAIGEISEKYLLLRHGLESQVPRPLEPEERHQAAKAIGGAYRYPNEVKHALKTLRLFDEDELDGAFAEIIATVRHPNWPAEMRVEYSNSVHFISGTEMREEELPLELPGVEITRREAFGEVCVRATERLPAGAKIARFAGIYYPPGTEPDGVHQCGHIDASRRGNIARWVRPPPPGTEPNAHYEPAGTTHVLKLLRPIDAGEEITARLPPRSSGTKKPDIRLGMVLALCGDRLPEGFFGDNPPVEHLEQTELLVTVLTYNLCAGTVVVTPFDADGPAANVRCTVSFADLKTPQGYGGEKYSVGDMVQVLSRVQVGRGEGSIRMWLPARITAINCDPVSYRVSSPYGGMPPTISPAQLRLWIPLKKKTATVVIDTTGMRLASGVISLKRFFHALILRLVGLNVPCKQEDLLPYSEQAGSTEKNAERFFVHWARSGDPSFRALDRTTFKVTQLEPAPDVVATTTPLQEGIDLKQYEVEEGEPVPKKRPRYSPDILYLTYWTIREYAPEGVHMQRIIDDMFNKYRILRARTVSALKALRTLTIYAQYDEDNDLYLAFETVPYFSGRTGIKKARKR